MRRTVLTRHPSYAQDGEDLLLDDLLDHKAEGFYVDVGAYHPTEFSNTKVFYDRGWSGINIEPVHHRYVELSKARPRDLNLNVGVASRAGVAELYCMEPAGLTTFVRSESERLCQFDGHRLVEVRRVEVTPLSAILDAHGHLPHIDFLSVDVEGAERDVLESNDWLKYRPSVVLIESAQYFPTSQTQRPSTFERWADVLAHNHYVHLGDTTCNSFFGDAGQANVLAAARRLWTTAR